jgi:hypothetical protein
MPSELQNGGIGELIEASTAANLRSRGCYSHLGDMKCSRQSRGQQLLAALSCNLFAVIHPPSSNLPPLLYNRPE